MRWCRSGPVEMEMFGYLDSIARSGLRKGTAPTRACPIRPPRSKGVRRTPAISLASHRYSSEGSTRTIPLILYLSTGPPRPSFRERSMRPISVGPTGSPRKNLGLASRGWLENPVCVDSVIPRKDRMSGNVGGFSAPPSVILAKAGIQESMADSSNF